MGKQKLITDYFKYNISNINIGSYSKNNKEIIRGYNEKTGSWHCTICGIDMGLCNPRQLCRKTYCEFE